MKTLALTAALTAGCASSATDPTWSVDTSTTQGALVGVWGNSADDVWAVGGQFDQSLVLHDDGTGWSRVPVPGSSLLWNVYGFSASDVYAVGERGLILHYDGSTWNEVSSNTGATLFGLWGATGQDVWIVGGDPVDHTAVILRGTATGFAPVTDLPDALRPSILYKAHGYGADNVLFVGTSGVLRYTAGTWSSDTLPATGPLFSTWGRASNDVYAVGGSSIATIVHYDGRAWTTATELPIGAGLSGVFTSPDAPTVAVGNATVVELDSDGTVTQPALPALVSTRLHGVWGDDQGATYVVGGDLAAYPGPMTGTILRRE